jgi:hypothetical protein
MITPEQNDAIFGLSIRVFRIKASRDFDWIESKESVSEASLQPRFVAEAKSQ